MSDRPLRSTEFNNPLLISFISNDSVIVTFNERDFPLCSLTGFEIEVQHPDEFISHLISLDWKSVCRALKVQRANLKNPPYSVMELLDTLERLKLPLTVSQLRPLEEFIYAHHALQISWGFAIFQRKVEIKLQESPATAEFLSAFSCQVLKLMEPALQIIESPFH